MKAHVYLLQVGFTLLVLLSPAMLWAQPPAGKQWQLTFRDEFDASTIDAAKWNTYWGPKGAGWRETWSLETNDDDNVILENGICKLRGGKENGQWKSGMLSSYNGFQQMYGYYEARVKTAPRTAYSSSFWMSPQSFWPPELDIMEAFASTTFITNQHWNDEVTGAHVSDAKNITGTNMTSAFHIVGMEWEPDSVRWFLDGVKIRTMKNHSFYPMYLIFNIHIGNRNGGFPGVPTNSDFADFEIDWVRCYSGPVTVSVANLREGSHYITGDSLLLKAAAATLNGRITKVEFLDNKTVLGEATDTVAASLLWRNLPTGKHEIRVRATDDTGASNISAPVTIYVSPLREPAAPAGALSGLSYRYYEGSWTALPNFASLLAAQRGQVATTTLAPRQRDNQFAFKYEGYVEVPQDGMYTFYTRSDDGSRLHIGSELVVDNDGLHGARERSGQIPLKAGKHALTVSYFQGTGGRDLLVSYEGPGISKQALPEAALSHVPFETEPPTVPGSLQASRVTNLSLSIGWQPATDNVGVAGYVVYRNDVLHQFTTGTSVAFSKLPAATEQRIRVVAVDEAGNLSEPALLTVPTLPNPAVNYLAGAPAPMIDGVPDTVWASQPARELNNVTLGRVSSAADLSGSYKALWDEENLYVLVQVTDDLRDGTLADAVWKDDGVEVYLDMQNDKAESYGPNDYQYQTRWNDTTLYEAKRNNKQNVKFAQAATADGYAVEFRFPWRTLGLTEPALAGLPGVVRNGTLLGLDVHISDDDGATRKAKKAWFATTDNSYQRPDAFGTVELHNGPAIAYREPENPADALPGLYYRYYETPYLTALPRFDTVAVVKAGVVAGFDLSPKRRSDLFAFQYDGYVDVPQEGIYTFYLASDDGSKLYIGDTQVVDNDSSHNASREKSGSIALKAGRHRLTVAYFDGNFDETLHVRWAGPGITKQALPAAALYRSPKLVSGLNYAYYEGVWQVLPPFETLQPVKTGVADNLDLSLRNRPDYFGFTFTGYVRVPTAGRYRFYLNSDDGSKLFIQNREVVSFDGLHGRTWGPEPSDTITLAAGWHPLTVTYFERTGLQDLLLYFEGPGLPKQRIPNASLARYPLTEPLTPALLRPAPGTPAPPQPQPEATSLVLYPNPLHHSEVVVRLTTPAEGPAEVRILDGTGRLVLKETFATQTGPNDLRVKAASLSNGFYHVLVTSGGKSFRQQLSVEK
ncbi:sugar-binding protein [Hymenobacter weizhouensis]|uniref:sugar-binding protein n=1 Tax=Hymenobacter sp. YIM 151500-1 TaxID=2987689 RepID=UPI0022280BB0|nr:sugar-binding protein [Hymenobacter sp. YIM 151500-1]UYZ63637.1 PA14 domain-containing protein [Hymenobacter sp. YIM 151500-1]